MQGDGPDLTLTPISRCSRGIYGCYRRVLQGHFCPKQVYFAEKGPFWGPFWADLVIIVKTGHFTQQLRARSSFCCFWGFKRVIYGNNYARVVLFGESHKCLDKGR